MAFPTIPTVGAGRVLTAVQANTTATRTFPNLSSLTKNSGDLLVAIVWGYQSSLTSAIFGTWGGGFTEIRDIGVASQHCVGVAYKISDGTESGTFSVVQGGTVTGHAAMILLSIPGAHASTAPEVSAALATGTAAAADPAALNPAGWDVEDTLWIVTRACGETSTTGSFTGLSTPATNYTDSAQTGISADAVGGLEAGVAFRQLAAASEDPGAGTCDTSNARNAALVIAVRPAAAATELTPTPVVLDLTLPVPTLDLSLGLAPTPVVLDLAVVAPDNVGPPPAINLQPTPVVLDLALPAPTLGLSISLSPQPVILDLSITTPVLGLALTLTGTPVLLDLSVPAPSLDLGPNEIVLAPTPVVLDLAVFAPALGLVLNLEPAPVPLDLALPAPQIGLGALELQATPVVLDLTVLGPVGQFGPLVIVSGSDHEIIMDAVEFWAAYDVADPATQRQLLRTWLLTHGGVRRLEGGFWVVKGGLFPPRYP